MGCQLGALLLLDTTHVQGCLGALLLLDTTHVIGLPAWSLIVVGHYTCHRVASLEPYCCWPCLIVVGLPAWSLIVVGHYTCHRVASLEPYCCWTLHMS